MNFQYHYNEDGLKVVEVRPSEAAKEEFGMERWQVILIIVAFGLVFGYLFYQAY